MLVPVPQPGSPRRRPARRRHSAGPRRPALSAVAPARSLPLPLAATPSPGASTQAFPRLQCLSGLTGISRPRGLTPSYTDRHTHAILTQTSSLLFPRLPLLARLPPTRSTPCRRHPASTGKPARRPGAGWQRLYSPPRPTPETRVAGGLRQLALGLARPQSGLGCCGRRSCSSCPRRRCC